MIQEPQWQSRRHPVNISEFISSWILGTVYQSELHTWVQQDSLWTVWHVTHRPFKVHLFSIFIGMNQCRCAKHSFNVHTTPAPMCSVWNVMRHCDIKKKKQQHSFYSSRTLSIVIAVIINTMSAQTQTKLTDNKSFLHIENCNPSTFGNERKIKKKKRTSEASDVEVKLNL